jgi:hypothetical protein
LAADTDEGARSKPMLRTGYSYVNTATLAPVDEFDFDEPTHPDLLAALPMRALVFGAANDDAACAALDAVSEFLFKIQDEVDASEDEDRERRAKDEQESAETFARVKLEAAKAHVKQVKAAKAVRR